MEENEKEMESELNNLRKEIKRLKLAQIDETQYALWGPDEIASWIINLDINRLRKYEEVLADGLTQGEVSGVALEDIDGADLKEWGIVDRKDRKFVRNEIGKLVANNAPKESDVLHPMEGANDAPTAYH